MVSSVAACCVLPMAHALLCIVNGMTRQFFVFVPGDLDLWPLTLTFEIERDFCTAYLTAKFDHPMFSRSEVIVRTSILTNKQTDKQTNTLTTDKQTPLKTSTSLRYATQVDNNSILSELSDLQGDAVVDVSVSPRPWSAQHQAEHKLIHHFYTHLYCVVKMTQLECILPFLARTAHLSKGHVPLWCLGCARTVLTAISHDK